MSPRAKEKGIELAAQLSPLHIGIEADRDMMNRVVMNLVSNAIKYTDSGGRVIVRTKMLDHEACLEVEDTGRGIPPESMERLFDKFYRVPANKDAAPGTGLGLALVKQIVEQVHGGRIEVESEVGKGSTFRVLLKLQSVGD